MDRLTNYFGQIPLETDLLHTNQNTMVALAKFCAGVLGTSTIVNAFTCTPTTPASLNVLVTPGDIYALANLEATTWSSLPADTAHSIVKQGILLDPATLGITPPGTVGYSQVYLIEVQYQDVDGGSTVLPYYNAANPPSPFSGPGNAGTAQNTVRKGGVAVQVKAGTAAATGTQLAPTADAGWTGLFLVTVANGQTTITGGNITQLASAPFIPVTLPKVPAGVQNSSWTYAADTGTANNLIVNPLPALTALQAGTWLVVKAGAAPTGPSVINPCGLGNTSIVNIDGSAIGGGQWAPGSILLLFCDGSKFQLINQLKQPGQPTYLQANLTLYVNGGTGSDTLYDGSQATISGSKGPFQTIQKAINQCALLNLNGFNIAIIVADWIGNTYAPIVLQAINGQGIISITGNITTPANCTIAAAQGPAIYCQGGPYIGSGFKLTSAANNATTGVAGAGALSTAGGILYLSNMEYGACFYAHIYASRGTISLQNAQKASGNAPYHMACDAGGLLITSAVGFAGQVALTIPSAITVTNFATVTSGATANITYQSITGAANVTGSKYSVTLNGILNTAGGGASYLPGSTAGTTATGGQYA